MQDTVVAQCTRDMQRKPRSKQPEQPEMKLFGEPFQCRILTGHIG